MTSFPVNVVRTNFFILMGELISKSIALNLFESLLSLSLNVSQLKVSLLQISSPFDCLLSIIKALESGTV